MSFQEKKNLDIDTYKGKVMGRQGNRLFPITQEVRERPQKETATANIVRTVRKIFLLLDPPSL